MKIVLMILMVVIVGGGSGWVGANFEKSWLTWGTPERKPDPYIQYLQHLGPESTGGGPVFQRALFDPYFDLYQLEQLFEPATGTDPGSFANYLQTVKPEIEVIRARASNILRALYALTPQERANKRLTFSFSAEGRTSAGDIATEQQQDLLHLALTSQFGIRGVQHLTSDGGFGRLLNLFKFDLAQGTGPNNFLDFLWDRLNLGEFFSTTQDSQPPPNPDSTLDQSVEDILREADERNRPESEVERILRERDEEIRREKVGAGR